MSDRDEFDKWLVATYGSDADFDTARNCYVDASVHMAWQAWRGREALELGAEWVRKEPKAGLLCGDVAISTDPRYAGWVFVRHVDGINWTTGAKLTPETWAMLAAAPKED